MGDNTTPTKPDNASTAQGCHNQAVAAWNEGKAESARDLMRAAISAHPQVATYHANLAMMLKGAAPPQERAPHYRQAIALDPTVPVWYTNLAAVLNEANDHTAAEATATDGLKLDAKRPETWFNLGSALAGQQRWQEAAQAFDTACKNQADWLAALLAAGQAYRSAGELRQSLDRYSAARTLLLQQTSQTPEQRQTQMGPVCQALGVLLSQCHQHAAAETHLREALQTLPGDLAVLTDLGNALTAQGKLDAAAHCYQQVVNAAPHLAGAHVNIGTICQTLGQHEEALAHYRAALEIDPALPTSYGNMGTSLTYSTRHGPADLKACYDQFDQLVAKPLLDPRPYTHEANDSNPHRPLRVGYVSPDFRRHAVAYFALPLLQGHRADNADNVQVFCYYNHRQNDEWTQRFKALSTGWVDCVGWDDATLAERIRADHIDILVDLAGHTEGGRLLCFARRPAPVQVTWMGYVTTTGLSAINYRLTHADADPVGVEADYAEKLVRLAGTMWCYRPLEGMPAVSPAPHVRNGFVTFGAFNRFSKASTKVLDCWASILAAVPQSQLLLCIPEGSVRQTVTQLFAAHGVEAHRLRFFYKVSHAEFWALHGEVDIALDPFPFGGGTTSCETLWLGVPLVTCTGGAGSFAPRFASRMGQVFLHALGLPELVTHSEVEYAQVATRLAHDPQRLTHLRQNLRQRMAASPLTDEPRFVREIESAYRQMWHDWISHTAPLETTMTLSMTPNMTQAPQTFLHVGCGPKRKDRTTKGFNTPDWHEIRLDIDASVSPDIIGTMTDMSAVGNASVDAIFSSHNIEHLYPHEVSVALAEFVRVLKPDGFLVLTCPDLQEVCRLVAQDKLLEPAYTSPAGPITPLDILYGHRPPMALGNLYMAHRCGFTEKVLIGTLRACGFSVVASRKRAHPHYDLYALASKSAMAEADMRQLAGAHFP